MWTKWQLWPKNVITQILQRLYYLISILERRRVLQKRQYKCKKCSNEYGGQTILQIHIKSHKKRLIQPSITNLHAKKIKVENEASDEKIKIKEEPLEDMKIKEEPLDY